MVDIDNNGRVRDVALKPQSSAATWGWMMAVWTPVFTEFMHNYLMSPRTDPQRPGAGLPLELTVGHVLQAAVRSGLYAQTVSFPDETYLDIGTPQALRHTLEAAAAITDAEEAAESENP
jgi:glucose-1-phosphate thymidylyltransferase